MPWVFDSSCDYSVFRSNDGVLRDDDGGNSLAKEEEMEKEEKKNRFRNFFLKKKKERYNKLRSMLRVIAPTLLRCHSRDNYQYNPKHIVVMSMQL